MNPYLLLLAGGENDVEVHAVDLGRRVREIREALGLTAEQAAKRGGVPTSDVDEFESTGTASVETMLALHRALSSSQGIDFLFTVPRFDTIDEYERHLNQALPQ